MISHILLDIEGTTCPVSFVTEDLFPYAQSALKDFLERHKDDASISRLINNAEDEWMQDQDEESTTLRQQSEKMQQPKYLRVESYLQLLIALDKKSTTLKDIQGKVWKEGYTTGKITSHLFEDAYKSLKKWQKQGFILGIYSSGSVEAQRLLYKYTSRGDIENLFSHWFDTHIGNKKEQISYTTIASAMACKPQNILFISDNSDECDAAKRASLRTLYSLRKGNPQQDAKNHPIISNLGDVDQWLK